MTHYHFFVTFICYVGAHHCRPGCRHLKCRGCVSNDVESRPTEKINERFVCWKIEERGAVGETPLHICMLRGAKDPKMLVLAERILRYFPEIMADIYVSDRFYGKPDVKQYFTFQFHFRLQFFDIINEVQGIYTRSTRYI